MNIDIKNVVMLALTLSTAACSHYYNTPGEKYYQNDRNGAHLVVPSPLSTANISHFYDLPPKPATASVNIRPPQNKIL